MSRNQIETRLCCLDCNFNADTIAPGKGAPETDSEIRHRHTKIILILISFLLLIGTVTFLAYKNYYVIAPKRLLSSEPNYLITDK